MKSKLIISICAAAVILSLSACGSSESGEVTVETTSVATDATDTEAQATTNEAETTTEAVETTMEAPTQSVSEASYSFTSTDSELYIAAGTDIENTLSGLAAEYETLIAEIDTYDKYLANLERIEAFYTKIYNEHHNLCIKMYEHSLVYAEAVINSDLSNDDKYDELEEIYDSIYEDAGDEIYKGVYDGLMEDMYDAFYDGLLDDAYDNDLSNYQDVYKIHSDEYNRWSDVLSDIYDDWSDMQSDIYGFYSDVRSEVWSDDIDRAKKKIENFRTDIEQLKGNTTQS